MRYACFLFVALLFLAFSNCKSSELGEQVKVPSPSLDSLWKKYEEFKQAERPESAVATLDSIMKIAGQQNASPHYVKAAYYTYLSIIQKEGETRGIEYLHQLLERNSGTQAYLLHYLTGLAYFEYYDHNQWEINSRTAITVEPKDIKTWGHEQFLANIQDHLFRAVDTQLRTESLGEWKLVLEEVDSGLVKYRPTLYDVIVPAVVEMLSSSNMQLMILDEAKWLKDERLLADIERFQHIELKDSLSSLDESILLFQNWLNWRENKDDAALAHADLARLNYFHQHSTHIHKDQLYIQALDRILENYSDTMALSRALLEKAIIYNQKGEERIAKDLNGWQKATSICNELMKRYPSTPYADNAENLLSQIQSSHLNVRMEEVNLPDKPFLVNIHVRNLSQLKLTAYSVSLSQLETIQKTGYREFPDILKKLERVNEKTYSLPVVNDHSYKNYELAHPALDGGLYLIVARADEAVFWTSIEVADLATYTMGGNLLMVVDRESGLPVHKASVVLKERNWRKPTEDSVVLTTDQDGKIVLDEEKRNYYIFRIEKEGSTHYPNLRLYNTGNQAEINQRRQIHLLTDRSIYRPGQAVYFKGILYRQTARAEWKVLKNENIEVELRDVNGQVIARKELETNAWGSIDGVFQLPVEVMTGNVILRTPFGSKSVKVEEYKRPVFSANIEVKKGETYTIGDSIQIEGSAETFNGIGLDNASVEFTVRRQYYIPWYYSYYPPVNENELEITNGKLTTDENGNFSFAFHAKADSAKDHARYNILIEVTDRGGETQTAELSVNLSRKPFQVTAGLSKILSKEKAEELEFRIVNNFGQTIKKDVVAKLSEVDGPEANKIDRYWEFPDSILIEESTFKDQFAYYSFQNNSRPDQWEILEEISVSSISSDSVFSLPNTFWNTATVGWYQLTFEDDGGNKINTYYFELLSPDIHHSVQSQLTLLDRPDQIEVGEQLDLRYIQPFQNSRVYTWISYPQSQDVRRWVKGGSIAIAPKEEDRGGVSLSLASVMHNRIYSLSDRIDVPWSNKALDIEVSTFRDVLQPGEKEEWTFTVSDPGAEVAAVLYDASLDEIYKHQWNTIHYPNYHKYIDVSHSGFQPAYMRTSIGFERGYRQFRLPEYPSFIFNARDRYYRKGEIRDGVHLEEAVELAAPRTQPTPPPPSSDSRDPNTYSELKEGQRQEQSQIRENLNETVFFLPGIHADESGEYKINFTMGEALTSWNLFLFGHTKAMETGNKALQVKTRKELMIRPLLPRFFRSGDTLQIVGRIQNQSGKGQEIRSDLTLTNALTGEDVLKKFRTQQRTHELSIPAGRSTIVEWTLIIPDAEELPAVRVEMWARSNDWSDGEANIIPLVSNRVIVQEALPLEVSPESQKSFDLKGWSQKYLKNPSARPLAYGLEVTKQPLWYAVQALPYLSEPAYENSEQLVNQIYANGLAAKVAREVPNLKVILEQWEKEGNLKSPLLKDQKWKSIDIDQTPWLRNALEETQQMKSIDLLLNEQQRSYKTQQSLQKLRNWQNADGGFSWFPGGPSNKYMSQYIAIQLLRISNMELAGGDAIQHILHRLIPFCDRSFMDWYKKVESVNGDKDRNIAWGLLQTHYYYLKSYEGNIPKTEAWKFLDSLMQKEWMREDLYDQALIARSWQLQDRMDLANKLLISFREKAIKDPVIGAYWNLTGLRRTYTDNIELHALMIEVFESSTESDFTQELKTWLIKNKQTNHWTNTKSTAAAIHALLLKGQSGLDDKGVVEISSGEAPIEWTTSSAIEGFHRSFEQEATSGSEFPISVLKIENGCAHPVWGAAYIQYSEEMDAIIPNEGESLKIEKRYFVEQWGVRGAELVPLEDVSALRVGDVLVARIILSVDRSMDFVHLKSERPSSMEPVSQISGFRYRDGLGYYESIKDLATHYFIDHLPKGTFVFEHRERVVLEGTCLGGLSQIESMYAPEFRAHTSGSNIETFEK